MGSIDPDAKAVAKLADHFTDSDAHTGPAATFTDSDALIDLDLSSTDLDAHIGVPVIDHNRDLKYIVDSLLDSPPCASLGRIPTSRLMRQVKSKLVDADDFVQLAVCDAVKDDFT